MFLGYVRYVPDSFVDSPAHGRTAGEVEVISPLTRKALGCFVKGMRGTNKIFKFRIGDGPRTTSELLLLRRIYRYDFKNIEIEWKVRQLREITIRVTKKKYLLKPYSEHPSSEEPPLGIINSPRGR